MIEIDVPGFGQLRLEAALVDLNGTLGVDGQVPPSVLDRLRELAEHLRVVVATADTFGTAQTVLGSAGVEVRQLTSSFGSAQKAQILEGLGPGTTVTIGNGANDHKMMGRAVLGIAVLGREGACWETLRKAHVVVSQPEDALDLLLVPKRLVATLRD